MRAGTFPGSHSLSSLAILDAMFLKPMLVPGNVELVKLLVQRYIPTTFILSVLVSVRYSTNR